MPFAIFCIDKDNNQFSFSYELAKTGGGERWLPLKTNLGRLPVRNTLNRLLVIVWFGVKDNLEAEPMECKR